MGKAWSAVTRSVRNINIENRVHRVLDKQHITPASAPRHNSKMKITFNDNVEKKEYTENFSEHQEKDDRLLHNLKDVKVDSFGPPPEIPFSRPLPEKKPSDTELEFGVVEPITISVGKISLRQGMSLITQHRTSPEEHTATKLAQEHKLDVAMVQQVLKYFQTLNVYIPKPELKDKNTKDIESAPISLEEKLKKSNVITDGLRDFKSKAS